jgi:6-pyruvoyltetrahydropterin 2'-reductase
MSDKKFRYSEIFHSFQGEGTYTGRSTAWIRFFLCNLQCNGFGQKDPTDPDTYVLPFEDFDVSSITRIEDLPVWDYGCDSSYTWAKKYKHLAHHETAQQICDEIMDTLKHESNPRGSFLHPESKQWNHMAFTGGEPLLAQNQNAMTAILQEFDTRNNLPRYVTVETNGTQLIVNHNLQQIIEDWYADGREWFWSVSPKLWSTAGEKPTKAIQPETVGEYAELSNHGHLKYVVNGTPESWEEVESATYLFKEMGVNWDVYIMPVGATKEEQEGPQIAEIAVEAMKRGYHVAPRVHCYVFGNQIGT